MEQPTHKTLIEQLKKIVEQEKIPISTIIEKTGISKGNIYRFFRAETIPRLDTFLKISDAISPIFSEEIKKLYQDVIED